MKTRHLEQPRTKAPELESVTEAPDDPGASTAPSSSPAWPLGLAAVAVLAAGGVLFALRSRRAAGDVGPDVTGPDAPAPDVAVDLAVTCADPRQAVLLAFEAAEALLAADSTTRRPLTASAREWSASVHLPALTRLVERYEIARFSRHAVTAEDRAVALDALRSLA
jgi:hypothetical protein